VSFIASLESAVFFLGERTTLLATCFLKDGAPIWESGSDFTGEMGLGIGVVFLVRIREVSAKSGGIQGLNMNERRLRSTNRSLRSTGERLSNFSFGSFKIAFQLPTPH
jgi:hypothetical protein